MAQNPKPEDDFQASKQQQAVELLAQALLHYANPGAWQRLVLYDQGQPRELISHPGPLAAQTALLHLCSLGVAPPAVVDFVNGHNGGHKQ